MKPIRIYTTRICPYCVSAKALLTSLNYSFEEIPLDNNESLRRNLSEKHNGWRTVPMIFIGDKFIGGYQELRALKDSGRLAAAVEGA